MTIRVCLVTSGRPFEIYYGGEEKFTLSFAKWLRKHDVESVLVARKGLGVQVASDVPNGTESAKRATPLLVQVPYTIFSIAMIFMSLSMMYKILRLNKKCRISIIHAQDTGYAGIAALLAHWILKVPAVISSHGVRYRTLDHIISGRSRIVLPFQWWLDVLSVRHANFVLALSPSVKNVLFRVRKKEMLAIPSAISIAQHATDLRARNESRNELGIKDEEVVFGFVGRLSPEKNPKVLIDAFKNFSRSRSGTRLLVVGTGPLEQELKMTCHEDKLVDRVTFTGARRDVPRLLQAIDIFVIPSHTEGSPLSLLEAMASAKAIIASDIPSIRDMLGRNECALLFNPTDRSGLERAMEVLSIDRDLRERLGHNAREKAKEYDENVIYERIRESYDELLDPGESKLGSNFREVASREMKVEVRW